MVPAPEPADPSGADVLRGHDGRDRHNVRVVVACGIGVLVGLLVGRTWAGDPTGDGDSQQSPLRVSLAGHAGGLDHQGRFAVVVLPLVVENLGDEPLRLVAVRVQGPGAGVRTSYRGGPSANLPLALAAHSEMPVRLALTSDCDVAVRPEPIMRLVVEDRDRRRDAVRVRVPDLASIWGQTLLPGVCPGR